MDETAFERLMPRLRNVGNGQTAEIQVTPLRLEKANPAGSPSTTASTAGAFANRLLTDSNVSVCAFRGHEAYFTFGLEQQRAWRRQQCGYESPALLRDR